QRGPARGERGSLRQDADGAQPPQPRQMQDGGIDARIHAKIIATHDNALPPFPFPAPRLAAVHVRFSMRALSRQIGWFLCVGCAAAATHWAVAVGCVEQLGLPPLAANAIGWLVAFVVSFTGHYRLTFRHLASRWTVAARRFFLISACGFLLNEAAYAWLLHITRVRYDAPLALILLGLAALTFLASRLWAFRRRPGAWTPRRCRCARRCSGNRHNGRARPAAPQSARRRRRRPRSRTGCRARRRTCAPAAHRAAPARAGRPADRTARRRIAPCASCRAARSPGRSSRRPPSRAGARPYRNPGRTDTSAVSPGRRRAASRRRCAGPAARRCAAGWPRTRRPGTRTARPTRRGSPRPGAAGAGPRRAARRPAPPRPAARPGAAAPAAHSRSAWSSEWRKSPARQRTIPPSGCAPRTHRRRSRTPCAAPRRPIATRAPPGR